jgi:hypothetical protein
MRSEKDLIDRLEREGFTEHFTVHDGALKSAERGDSFAPGDVVIREFARYEGVSDPDDMSVIYAIETRDGRRGTLTDGFGVYASPAVSAFVESVEKPSTAPVVPLDVGTPPGPAEPGA